MSPAQGDAILDVLEQCADVTAAWNQRCLVARNSKRKAGAVQTLEKEVSDAYQESKEHLGYLYKEALSIGCDEGSLNSVIINNLPTSVLRDIMSELD